MTASHYRQVLTAVGSVQPRSILLSRPGKGLTPHLRYAEPPTFRKPSPSGLYAKTAGYSLPGMGSDARLLCARRLPSLRLIHFVSLAVFRRSVRRVRLQVHRCYVRCVAGFTRSPLQCRNGVSASPSTVNRIRVSPFPFAFALLKPPISRFALRRTEMSKNANPWPTCQRVARAPFAIPCGLAIRDLSRR